VLLWVMNLGFAGGGASSSSGEHRLTNAFAAENRLRQRELNVLLAREDEEILIIMAALAEIL